MTTVDQINRLFHLYYPIYTYWKPGDDPFAEIERVCMVYRNYGAMLEEEVIIAEIDMKDQPHLGALFQLWGQPRRKSLGL